MISSELSLANKKRPQDIAFERCMICVTITYLLVMTPLFQGAIFKLISGVTLVASEIFAVSTIIILYKNHFFKYSKTQKFVLFLLYGFNILLTIQGVFSSEYKFLTYWGNTGFQPAFFLPFYILIGADVLLFKILFKYIVIFSFATILSIPFGIESMVTYGLLLFFIISFAKFLNRKMRFLFFVIGGLYILACFIEDARTPALRTIFAYIIYIYSCVHSKVKVFYRRIIMFIAMTLPLYFFLLFATTGESVFNTLLEEGGEHSTDTRTFLYEEVLLDVVDNDALLFGKGVNGAYYSNYFFKHDGDSADRVNVEVGILSFLLKGGVVLIVLSLLILSMAIYSSFVKSNILLLNIIGALLLIHFLFLFLEHIPQYGMLYMTFQFLIGVGLTNNKFIDDRYVKYIFSTSYNYAKKRQHSFLF